MSLVPPGLEPFAELSIVIARQTRFGGLPLGGRLVGEAASCELTGTGRFAHVRAHQAGASGDWVTLCADGSVRVDARLLLATGRGTLTVQYTGRAAAPPATGVPVHIVPTFETDDPDLLELNTVQGVGRGVRDGSSLVYSLFLLG